MIHIESGFQRVLLALIAVAMLLTASGHAPYSTTIIQSPEDNCLTGVPSANVVEDAWLAEVRPDVSWGNCANVPAAVYKLFIGDLAYVPDGATGNEYRTVIKFNLSDPAVPQFPTAAVIVRAVLTITQTWCQVGYGDIPPGCSGARLTIEAHQVLPGPFANWTENSARWMDMPPYDPTPLSVATVLNVKGAKLNLDITKAFKKWRSNSAPNNGVILIANPLPNNDFFRGRSHDTVCDPVQGCSGGQGSPPGADGPKLTVTWHLP